MSNMQPPPEGSDHARPDQDPIYEFHYEAMELLGNHLRRLRREKKLTQLQVAKGAKMDVKHYQKLELEVWDDVRLSTVEKLAGFYGLNAWRLLEAPLFREVPSQTSPAPVQQQSSRSGKAKRR